MSVSADNLSSLVTSVYVCVCVRGCEDVDVNLDGQIISIPFTYKLFTSMDNALPMPPAGLSGMRGYGGRAFFPMFLDV